MPAPGWRWKCAPTRLGDAAFRAALFWRIRVPSAAGFRLDVCVTHARRRIRDPNQVFAGGALNLTACVTGVALQWLVTVGAVEFEFEFIHKLRN